MTIAAKQGLVDLLTRIGDDKAVIQTIHQTVTGAKRTKGGGTEVSFWTDQMTPDDLMRQGGKVGIVVWLDRADIKVAQAAFQAELALGDDKSAHHSV